MTILFFDEQMTITYTGLDQRKGKECPPFVPTIVQVDNMDIRPRGVSIIDLVQDGDKVTITANGNGTGTVTVLAFLPRDDDPILTGKDQGSHETSAFGSRSVINGSAPAAGDEVTVLEPKRVVEIEQEFADPEKDCQT
jgi:hypothetical protein